MAQTQSVRAINPIGKMRFRNLTVTTEKMRLVGEDFISNKSNKLLNLAGRKVRYSLLKLTSHRTRTNWENKASINRRLCWNESPSPIFLPVTLQYDMLFELEREKVLHTGITIRIFRNLVGINERYLIAVHIQRAESTRLRCLCKFPRCSWCSIFSREGRVENLLIVSFGDKNWHLLCSCFFYGKFCFRYTLWSYTWGRPGQRRVSRARAWGESEFFVQRENGGR